MRISSCEAIKFKDYIKVDCLLIIILNILNHLNFFYKMMKLNFIVSVKY